MAALWSVRTVNGLMRMSRKRTGDMTANWWDVLETWRDAPRWETDQHDGDLWSPSTWTRVR